jgi:hypothetical protein
MEGLLFKEMETKGDGRMEEGDWRMENGRQKAKVPSSEYRVASTE